MKILVISDTHGYIAPAQNAIMRNPNIDLIIHLGDSWRDAYKLSLMFPNIPIEYIRGNCDFASSNVPDEKLLELGGKRVFITHGHRYAVKKDYSRLQRKASELDADLVLFGHTHTADIVETENCCLINPGSTSDPRSKSHRSYALVEIDDGVISPGIVGL